MRGTFVGALFTHSQQARPHRLYTPWTPVRNFCSLGSLTAFEPVRPNGRRLEIFRKGLCLNIPDLTRSGATNSNRKGLGWGLLLDDIRHWSHTWSAGWESTTGGGCLSNLGE